MSYVRVSNAWPVALSNLVLLLSTGCVVFERPVSRDASLDSSPQQTDAGHDARVDLDDAAPPADVGVDAFVEPDVGVDGGPTCVVATIPTYDDCPGSIVINEVDGSGEDFIEIYNRGDSAVNISNWVIADESAGAPDVAEGVVVPPGTTLDPDRYLYVWANLTSPQPGLRDFDCLPGAPPPCLHSGWGISNSGERLFLLDGSLNIVCTFQYPNAIFGGEAFGRVEDGATTLCPTTPTPGEMNTPSTLR